MAMNPPRETIYFNNLNDKLSKDELKRNLYYLCSQFGPIVDIVAMKTDRTRGQAFVIYRDIQCATTAMKSLQGFTFFNKPLRVAYARTKSECIAKLDGTFRKKDARIRQKEKLEKDRKFAERQKAKGVKAVGEAGKAAIANRKRPREDEGGDEKKSKKEVGDANNVLFVTGVPADQPETLQVLFKPFAGFKEIRVPPIAPGKTVGNAFVEFETAHQASTALTGLQGFQITDEHAINISFARK
eukprot:Sspe_Gene.75236::Locus_47015_Transcript_1_1_Confidence_1.000_Length_842::g.75236::m.75236/K11094/SNRPB2; U2 small nuclear ribonucleoprotein B''